MDVTRGLGNDLGMQMHLLSGSGNASILSFFGKDFLFPDLMNPFSGSIIFNRLAIPIRRMSLQIGVLGKMRYA